MESKGWLELVRDYTINDNHISLIRALQGIHDDVKPSRWRGALNRFAKMWDLFES